MAKQKGAIRVSKKGKNMASSSTKDKIKRAKGKVINNTKLTDSKVDNETSIAGLTPSTSAADDNQDDPGSIVPVGPEKPKNIVQGATTAITNPHQDYVQDNSETELVTEVNLSYSAMESNYANDNKIPINIEKVEEIYENLQTATQVTVDQTYANKTAGSELKSTAVTVEKIDAELKSRALTKEEKVEEIYENLQTATQVTVDQTFANKTAGSELKSTAVTVEKIDAELKSRALTKEMMNAQHPRENIKIIKILPRIMPKYIYTKGKVSLLNSGTNFNNTYENDIEQNSVTKTLSQNVHVKTTQIPSKSLLKPPQSINKSMILSKTPYKRKLEDRVMVINENVKTETPQGQIIKRRMSLKAIKVLDTVTISQAETNNLCATDEKDKTVSKNFLKNGSYTKLTGTADHVLIHAPNPAKELQAEAPTRVNSNDKTQPWDTVIYDNRNHMMSGVRLHVMITHGYNPSVYAVMTNIAIRRPNGNKSILSNLNSNHIVKTIGQTNYETVMNSLFMVPNQRSRVDAIIALLNKKYDTSLAKDKICQTNDSALRQINDTKVRLTMRPGRRYKRKAPYVVTDKHTQMLMIGKTMNEQLHRKTEGLTNQKQLDLEDNPEKIILNNGIDDGCDEQISDDNCSVGNISSFTNFTENTEKLNNALTSLNYDINQVTQTNVPATIPNLTEPNLFADINEQIRSENIKNKSTEPYSFQQDFLKSFQSQIPRFKIIKANLNVGTHDKTYCNKRQSTTNTETPLIIGQTSSNFGQTSSNIGQTSSNIGQTQQNASQIASTAFDQNPFNQDIKITEVRTLTKSKPTQSLGQNEPNFGQNKLIADQMQPRTGQTQPNTVHTVYYQPNISQPMENSDQNNLNQGGNGFEITMSDGYKIWVAVKPEDEFHIATPDNLKALGPQDQRKLILHQAYIDFKLALDMDQYGNYPIHRAVLANDMEWLRRQYCALRMRGNTVDVLCGEGLTALEMSLYADTSATCATLIQLGADPLMPHQEEGRTVLHAAAEMGADYLIDVVHACVANARAIISCHVVKLQKNDWSSLSDEELGYMLMEYINAKSDDQGYTPLMLASKLGLYENVRTLVECQRASRANVDHDMPTCGSTALYLAVSAACADCHGGDSKRDLQLYMPFESIQDISISENSNMAVVSDNFSKTIECLIENGADLNKVNYSGFSPISLAQEMNMHGLNALLTRISAKNENNIAPIKSYINVRPESLMIIRDPISLPPKSIIFKSHLPIQNANELFDSTPHPKQSVKDSLEYGENSKSTLTSSPENKTQKVIMINKKQSGENSKSSTLSSISPEHKTQKVIMINKKVPIPLLKPAWSDIMPPENTLKESKVIKVKRIKSSYSDMMNAKILALSAKNKAGSYGSE